MRRISPTAVALAVVTFGILLTGCSSNPPVSSGVEAAANLSDPFGGYAATDETVGFGEEVLAGLADGGEAVSDPLIADADLDSLRDHPGVKVYMLAVRWGMLEGDSTVTAVTDWSGGTTVARGAVAVRRLIRFEHGQDEIVRPRTSRQKLEWVAQTTVHFDGLILMIIDPPTHPDSAVDDNLLTITAGAYSRTFNITTGDLDEFDEIVDVDAAGNQIAFNARTVVRHGCGGGPLHGFWAFDSTGTGGRFFGGWSAEDGRPRGHLRGHFGTREGREVFFGKIIGAHGEFEGFFRGRWGFAGDNRRHGWFEGEWVAEDDRLIGRLRGRWADGPPPEDRPQGPRDRGREGIAHPQNGSGFFSGGWHRVCLGALGRPGDGV